MGSWKGGMKIDMVCMEIVKRMEQKKFEDLLSERATFFDSISIRVNYVFFNFLKKSSLQQNHSRLVNYC